MAIFFARNKRLGGLTRRHDRVLSAEELQAEQCHVTASCSGRLSKLQKNSRHYLGVLDTLCIMQEVSKFTESAHPLPGNLPPEIWHRIMSFVEANDLLSLGRCSRVFKDMVDSDDLWRRLFLHKFGTKAPPVAGVKGQYGARLHSYVQERLNVQLGAALRVSGQPMRTARATQRYFQEGGEIYFSHSDELQPLDALLDLMQGECNQDLLEPNFQAFLEALKNAPERVVRQALSLGLAKAIFVKAFWLVKLFVENGADPNAPSEARLLDSPTHLSVARDLQDLPGMQPILTYLKKVVSERENRSQMQG